MKNSTHRSSHKNGVALVEVLVGAAIISSAFVGILGVYASLSKLSARSLPRIQAAMIAEEGVEALRSIRDGGYDASIGALSSGTEYQLHWSTASSSFSATTTAQPIDGTFYRVITFSDVSRDGSYNIAASGTPDPDTRLATIEVSWWDRGATSTYELQSYLSNTFNN